MCGRNRIHVEDFAIGGVAAVEIVAVPRGHAHFAVVDIFLRRVFPAGNGIGLADAVDAAALRHRLAWLDHPGTGRGAVFRIDFTGKTARAIGERETAGHEPGKTRKQAEWAIAPESTHPATKSPNAFPVE